MRYAIATGRADRDPTADLKGALTKPTEKHHAAITDPKELGGLLRAIDTFTGTHIVRCALQLAPLLFVRPNELCTAEWSEFDLNSAEWSISAARMKTGQAHLVRLPAQAPTILHDLYPARSRTVFAADVGLCERALLVQGFLAHEEHATAFPTKKSAYEL